MIDCAYGSSLTVTGNGTVDIGKHKSVSFIAPRGTVVIENGTFKRDYDPNDTGAGSYGSLFIGINVDAAIRAGVENAYSNVIIKDGYFDGGFYAPDKGAISGITHQRLAVQALYGADWSAESRRRGA